MGQCTLKHWSTTQSTIALSSGEAELGELSRGASLGLGFKSMAADLGMNVNIVVHSDSSAAIGISRRRGLGKILHSSVADLWSQERLRSGEFDLCDIAGTENPADVLTKFVEKPTLCNMLNIMNLVNEDGRATSTPNIAAVDYFIDFLKHRWG